MVGKPSICRFVAIEKRHIAAALLLCPEDGTGAVQLSVVLFLAANNGCTNGCTTADKHKDNQQSRVACVAGLRNGVLRCGCRRSAARQLHCCSVYCYYQCYRQRLYCYHSEALRLQFAPW